MGALPVFGDVWFHPEVVGRIIYLDRVKYDFRC